MLKTIYILRSQCDEHGEPLDKMDVFYLVKDSTKHSMYKQMKEAVTKVFALKHGCFHDIKFTEERERDFKWDTRANKEVKI